MDIYRGDILPEKNFGEYALFVSYFPQLVAGPIERSTNLLPQLQKETSADHLNKDGARKFTNIFLDDINYKREKK